MKLIFIFLDGVGLSARAEHNPFFLTPMLNLKTVLGRELFLEDATLVAPNRLLIPLDASLGVEGAGESGTGQFSIYTGLNGAKLFGRHFGAHIPSMLRPILEQENIFKQLKRIGKNSLYANAYPQRFIDWCLDLRTKGKIRSSVLFEAAVLENITIRSAEEVKHSQAVSGDIISRWWKMNETDGDKTISEVSPEQAARNLLSLSANADAVFYEFFLTDLSAHGRIQTPKAELISRLDAFLSTLISDLPAQDLLVLTSDHGNFEDSRTKQHTLNPVPLLASGNSAGKLCNVTSLDQLCPALLSILS